MTEYVRVDCEDWAALYADGKLIRYADAYLIDEYLFYQVLHGKSLSSDAYYQLSGDENWDGQMPQTLEEYRALLTKGDECSPE